MERVYYKITKGKRSKPFLLNDFKELGALFEDEFIWYDGLDKWTIAKEIEELKSFALPRPPSTIQETRNLFIRKSLFISLGVFIVYSFLLGLISGMIEFKQYQDFTNQTTSLYMSDTGGVPVSDVYVYDVKSGGNYTRWSVYLGGADNEQLSYNNNHSFLFRPYKAIFSNAYLSIEERNNKLYLILNFIFSSLITNLLFIPLLIIGVFFYLKKRESSHNEKSEPTINKELTRILLSFFIICIGFVIYAFLKDTSTKTNFSKPNSNFPVKVRTEKSEDLNKITFKSEDFAKSETKYIFYRVISVKAEILNHESKYNSFDDTWSDPLVSVNYDLEREFTDVFKVENYSDSLEKRIKIEIKSIYDDMLFDHDQRIKFKLMNGNYQINQNRKVELSERVQSNVSDIRLYIFDSLNEAEKKKKTEMTL